MLRPFAFMVLALMFLIAGCDEVARMVFDDGLARRDIVGAREADATGAPDPHGAHAALPGKPPTAHWGLMDIGAPTHGWEPFRRHVPQVAHPGHLLREARDPSGPIEDGLLACEARIDGGNWDNSDAPDVTLEVTLDGATHVLLGPEDEYRFPVSLPGVHLRVGEQLSVRATDRDLIFHDDIGTAAGSHGGEGPVVVEGRSFRLECRVVDRATTLERAAGPLARADRHLAALDASLEPRLGAPNLGYPREMDIDAREAIAEAVAWRGWMAPEVVARVERVDALVGQWRERLGAAIVRGRVELPAPGETSRLGNGLSGAVVERACGAEATHLAAQLPPHSLAPDERCLVRMHLINDRPQERTLLVAASAVADVPLSLLHDDGKWYGIRVLRLGRPGDERTSPPSITLAPGGVAEILFAEPDLPGDAPLLVARRHGGDTVLRLE
jgi:hypothetical protein